MPGPSMEIFAKRTGNCHSRKYVYPVTEKSQIFSHRLAGDFLAGVGRRRWSDRAPRVPTRFGNGREIETINYGFR